MQQGSAAGVVLQLQGGVGGSTSVLTERGRLLLERYNAYEKALKEQANDLYDRYFGGLFT